MWITSFIASSHSISSRTPLSSRAFLNALLAPSAAAAAAASAAARFAAAVAAAASAASAPPSPPPAFHVVTRVSVLKEHFLPAGVVYSFHAAAAFAAASSAADFISAGCRTSKPTLW